MDRPRRRRANRHVRSGPPRADPGTAGGCAGDYRTARRAVSLGGVGLPCPAGRLRRTTDHRASDRARTRTASGTWGTVDCRSNSAPQRRPAALAQSSARVGSDKGQRRRLAVASRDSIDRTGPGGGAGRARTSLSHPTVGRRLPDGRRASGLPSARRSHPAPAYRDGLAGGAPGSLRYPARCRGGPDPRGGALRPTLCSARVVEADHCVRVLTHSQLRAPSRLVRQTRWRSNSGAGGGAPLRHRGWSPGHRRCDPSRDALRQRRRYQLRARRRDQQQCILECWRPSVVSGDGTVAGPQLRPVRGASLPVSGIEARRSRKGWAADIKRPHMARHPRRRQRGAVRS